MCYVQLQILYFISLIVWSYREVIHMTKRGGLLLRDLGAHPIVSVPFFLIFTKYISDKDKYYIPRYSAWCNKLAMPEIPASGTKCIIYIIDHEFDVWGSNDYLNKHSRLLLHVKLSIIIMINASYFNVLAHSLAT